MSIKTLRSCVRPLAFFFVTNTLQYESLRRVHLIPPGDFPGTLEESQNINVFRDLDSAVSEGGENFSTGFEALFTFRLIRVDVSLRKERSNCCAWHGRFSNVPKYL